MPLPYLRRLTGKHRSQQSNRHLALFLAAIAGAANAGGFLAVHQYTSHMSGIVSSMADNSATGDLTLTLAGLSALLAFTAGAALTAILVNWARRRHLHSQYALPLMLEAGLLLAFGLLGNNLESRHWLYDPATVLLLCFTMGLQNAIITKISHAEIRTTHVTGIVTDIGIELGKLLYWNRTRPTPPASLPPNTPSTPVTITPAPNTPGISDPHPSKPNPSIPIRTNPQHPQSELAHPVRADRDRLRILTSLLTLFFLGGILGALGFKHLGFATTIPLAALLVILAIVPILDDLRA